MIVNLLVHKRNLYKVINDIIAHEKLEVKYYLKNQN